MNVFIPSGGKDDWGKELLYTLRSLDQYFEPINLTVYSTKPHEWLTGCDQRIVDPYYPSRLNEIYKSKKYEHWFDSINKLKLYARSCTEERFIYTYDDIMLLREATAKDIIHYPQEKITPKHMLRYARHRHGETILSAIGKCRSPVLYNYETHLPRIYETEKLLHLFKEFPLKKEVVPYSIASLYFNYFGNDVEQELVNVNNYKAGFYGKPEQGNGYLANSIQEVDDIVADKTWLNYSFVGLMMRDDNGVPVLQEWIKQRFNKPSKYEILRGNND